MPIPGLLSILSFLGSYLYPSASVLGAPNHPCTLRPQMATNPPFHSYQLWRHVTLNGINVQNRKLYVLGHMVYTDQNQSGIGALRLELFAAVFAALTFGRSANPSRV